MKKSVAITTIVAIHAAVIGVLLIQAGCSSDKEVQPPKANSAVEEVTTISNGDNAVSETKENKIAEGSPTLRAAPTRPTESVELPKADVAENKVQEQKLNDTDVVEPLQPKQNKDAQPKEANDASTTVYVVKKGDSISKIASKHGISSSKLLALNSIKNANSIRVGQKLKVPSKAGEASVPAAEEVAPAPVSLGEDSATYVVKKGDSLSKIAYKNDMSVKQLMQVNGLKNANIRVGQKLTVKKSGAAKVEKKEATAPAKVASAEGEISHKVKAGEFLGLIASKYGVKVSAIKKRNNISDPRKIRVGQTIIIPAKAGAKVEKKPEQTKEAPKVEEKKTETPAPQASTVETPAQQTQAPQAPVVVPEKTTTAPQAPQQKASETIEVTEL